MDLSSESPQSTVRVCMCSCHTGVSTSTPAPPRLPFACSWPVADMFDGGEVRGQPTGGKKTITHQLHWDLTPTKLKVLPSSSKWLTVWHPKIPEITRNNWSSSLLLLRHRTFFCCCTPWKDALLFGPCFSFCPVYEPNEMAVEEEKEDASLPPFFLFFISGGFN